jgi:uncharacterized protein YbjT (DUF2867 family)
MNIKSIFKWMAVPFFAAAATVTLGATNASTTERAHLQQVDTKMKNVILIGANGHTSQEIIPRLLLQKDVQLTLFLRNASRLQDMESDRVKVVEGDATSVADLSRAIKGQDIVISTMGGNDLDFKTANILQAMKDTGSRHFIVVSAGGIYDELPEPFNTWDKRMVGGDRIINRRVADETEQSGLTYTVLRPVWLTNKPVEDYQLTRKGEQYKGTETSRASLARFIAEVVANPERYANQNLGISQTDTEGSRPAAYR